MTPAPMASVLASELNSVSATTNRFGRSSYATALDCSVFRYFWWRRPLSISQSARFASLAASMS